MPPSRAGGGGWYGPRQDFVLIVNESNRILYREVTMSQSVMAYPSDLGPQARREDRCRGIPAR